MARGDASGISVKAADIPTIIGMIARGDRHHDIAAWFGLKPRRIADTQDGKYGPHGELTGPQATPKRATWPERPGIAQRQSIRLSLVSPLAIVQVE